MSDTPPAAPKPALPLAPGAPSVALPTPEPGSSAAVPRELQPGDFQEVADEANFSLKELDAVAEPKAPPPAKAPGGRLKLSVVIPCYNETKSIRDILAAVRAVDLPKEIIVVDDFSKDGSRDLLQGELKPLFDRLVLHEKNKGKGAALRTGFEHASGDVVIVQDADLEYDPQDWKKMLPLIESGKADVVFGSRFAPREERPVLRYWHTMINRMLTRFSNMFSDTNLTDMETCYKMFRTEVIRKIRLKENRFGFEPEVTAKVARLGVRIYEVPISYHPRSFKQGKKIGIKDGFRAIWCILKYNLFGG
jgi:glycosyltransferase involved in cell wall biosynthesis